MFWKKLLTCRLLPPLFADDTNLGGDNLFYLRIIKRKYDKSQLIVS